MTVYCSEFKLDWLKLALTCPTSNLKNYSFAVASEIENCFDARAQSEKPGMNNYKFRIPVGVGSDRSYQNIATVQYGGNTTSKLGDHVQLDISGGNAHLFYLNSDFRPPAYIQRVDFAYDVTGDYEAIISAVNSLDDFARLKRSVISETIDGVTATTTYYGSRESAFFIRIYEKGKQTGSSPDWVRIEIEVKPTKTSVDFAVWCYEQLLTDPEVILTRCKHVHSMLTALTTASLSPYTPRDEKPVPDDIRAFSHMVSQYAGVVAGMSQRFTMENLTELFRTIHNLKQQCPDVNVTQEELAAFKQGIEKEIQDAIIDFLRPHVW